MTLNASVIGLTGRMGGEVLNAAMERTDIQVVNGIASSSGSIDDIDVYQPGDAGDAFSDVDVVIDFSKPEVIDELIPEIKKSKCKLVTGTTGLSDSTQDKIRDLSRDTAVLQSSNFATGVNVFWRLIEEAADHLPGFDYEVMEAHHRHKTDSPSGTAKTAIEKIKGQIGDRELVHGREGESERGDEIGVHSIRAGEIVGVHSVFISGPGEYLELNHNAVDRSAFAEGSLDAAVYINQKNPGLYGMDDVLGF